MRMGALFLGILGALGNSYSILQSTKSGLDKSFPTGGAISPLGFDFGFDKLLEDGPETGTGPIEELLLEAGFKPELPCK